MDIEKLIEDTLGELLPSIRVARDGGRYFGGVDAHQALRAAFDVVRRAAIEECAGHLRDLTQPGAEGE